MAFNMGGTYVRVSHAMGGVYGVWGVWWVRHAVSQRRETTCTPVPDGARPRERRRVDCREVRCDGLKRGMGRGRRREMGERWVMGRGIRRRRERRERRERKERREQNKGEE